MIRYEINLPGAARNDSLALCLTLLLMATSVAYGSSAEANGLSLYFEETYVREALQGIDGLLSDDLVGVLATSNPVEAAKTIEVQILTKTDGLVEDTTNIAAAKLKSDDIPEQFDGCDFFALSVGLRGVRESLGRMRSCIEQNCDADKFDRERGKLFLRAARLENAFETCAVGIGG